MSEYSELPILRGKALEHLKPKGITRLGVTDEVLEEMGRLLERIDELEILAEELAYGEDI